MLKLAVILAVMFGINYTVFAEDVYITSVEAPFTRYNSFFIASTYDPLRTAQRGRNVESYKVMASASINTLGGSHGKQKLPEPIPLILENRPSLQVMVVAGVQRTVTFFRPLHAQGLGASLKLHIDPEGVASLYADK
jgi:hypothetical protein